MSGEQDYGDSNMAITAPAADAQATGDGEGMVVTGAMLNRPLYAIAGDYLELVDQLVARGGEMDETALVALDSIQDEIGDKLENCAAMAVALWAQGDVLKAEERRIAARRKAVEGRADWVAEYVRRQMKRIDLAKYVGRLLTVKRQETPPSCDVINDSMVPVEYVEVTIKMTGVGWNNLQAVLATVIPDQTNPAEAAAHWGGPWTVTRSIKKRPIIDEWKKCGGAADVPGTHCEKGETLRIR